MTEKRNTRPAGASGAGWNETVTNKYHNAPGSSRFTDEEINRARHNLPGLDEVAGDALVKKSTKEYAGPCPQCGGKDRFFWSVGAVNGYCRQCDHRYDTIDIEMMCTGKTFSEVVADALGRDPFPSMAAKPKNDNSKRAAEIWRSAKLDDNAILAYFRWRDIQLRGVQECFRLAPSDNPKLGEWIFVARVSKPGESGTKAVHRTYLDSKYKGTGHKRMLGSCRGRAVWMSDPAETMLMGEGIETTLSVMAATGMPGVACLSTAGMENVVIPDQVKEIIILVDSDPNHAGQKAAKKLSSRFSGKSWFVTPDDSCFTDNPKKLDFNDLSPDQIKERFKQLIDLNEIVEPDNKTEISLFDENGEPKTKATVLIEIGSQYELFHDPKGDGYATIPVNGHKETWPINSKFFKNLLADQYFMLSDRGVSRNIIGDAIDTLQGQARVRGKLHKVHMRVADSSDDKIYIDLCDDSWRVVEVTEVGWKILQTPPVKFLRSTSSISLPTPEENGTLDDLWSLMNVSENDRPLVFGFLVRALQARPPFFAICVVGEQGTGKSFITELLRYLCDPSTSPTSSPPKDERDFFAGAINNWCITYDNMSGVQPWLSDSLCRVLTGTSFSCRTLYTTTEETTVSLARPVVLNGIDDLASRPDLADRTIALNLQPIKPDGFKTVEELWKRYDQIKGRAFGALLSGISTALRNAGSIDVAYKSRMLSATKWVAAAEQGACMSGFIDAYARNQKDMVIISLESSPFIAAMLDMITEEKTWRGTPADLQRHLPQYARDDEAIKSKAWPKSPVWVSRFIRRHAPALRKIGMIVECSRKGAERHIYLKITVNSKKVVTSGQEKIKEPPISPPISAVQRRKNTVITVIPSQNALPNDSNDGNDGKNPTLPGCSEPFPVRGKKQKMDFEQLPSKPVHKTRNPDAELF